MTEEDFLVIDLETTGLIDGVNEIVEIGVLLVNLTREDNKIGFEVKSKFHTYIKPSNPLRINPEAMGINQIDSETLAKAPNAMEARQLFYSWWESEGNRKFEVLGHNFSGFDKGFLKLFLSTTYDNFLDYHAEDTYAFARGLQRIGLIQPNLELHLADLMEYFDYAHRDHTALGDCYATIRVYCELLNKVASKCE